MEHRPPFFISSEVAKTVFDWRVGIGALQTAYSSEVATTASPQRVVARDDGAWLRVLPALPPSGRYYGAKIMAMATGAERPGAEYVTVLFDRRTSRIAAFVDAASVTGFRTAATTAAALDRMAPPGAMRLGVLGSGLEASMHIRAFAAIRPLSDVAIYSTTAARREALAADLSAELGISCRAADRPETACSGATVVLAAARSRGETPTLYGDWLAPGATTLSIGSTVPEQREVDVSVISQADIIVCDAVDEVLEQTGDMIEAKRAGITVHDRAFAMTALMRGVLDERLANAQHALFKSVGGGMQDVVIAEMILTAALEAGLAQSLPIEFQTKTRS